MFSTNELSNAPGAWKLMEPARKVVRTELANDSVRRALAAMRGEGEPLEKLDGMSGAPLKQLLDENHRMSTQVAQRNIGSLVVLGLFGLLVLGALAYVFKSLV